MKVLYSFPWSIGESGIGYTAWEQVNELTQLGCEVHLLCGYVQRPFEAPPAVLHQTMSLKWRKLPAKLLGGMDAAARFHDARTAAYLRRHRGALQVFHGWPLASEQSLAEAGRQGVPAFLERPNTHTEHAYEVTSEVYSNLGIPAPLHASHRPKPARLAREEREYTAADYLLCPSAAVMESFQCRGYARDKLVPHRYGYSPTRIATHTARGEGFRAIFIGNDGARKGLHDILTSWSRSEATAGGRLDIFGALNPEYREHIKPLLNQPGVHYHGFSSDVSAYLSQAHCLLLSSYEEGSALVTYEARAAGCVLVVSEQSGAIVEHGRTGLVHRAGDIAQLQKHINALYLDRGLLERLRSASLADLNTLTWTASVRALIDTYRTLSAPPQRDSRAVSPG